MIDKIKVQDERSFGFSMIDNELLDNEEIDIYAQSVYLALCRFASNDDRTCFPSAEAISKKAKCSRRKVFDALSLLEKLGYIKREQRVIEGQKKSSIYHVMGARHALSMCASCTTLVRDMHEGSAQHAHRTIPNELDSKNYIPPISPQGGEEAKEEITSPAQDFPKAVADLWNEVMPHAPQVKVLSKSRRTSINARRKDTEGLKDLKGWRSFFERVKASKLNGRGEGRYVGKVVAFDTVIRPSVTVKILEGVYDIYQVESPYVGKALGWLRENYPKPESVNGAVRQFLRKLMPMGTTEEEKKHVSLRLLEELEGYLNTDEVKDGFIKSCSNWLGSIDWQGGFRR